VPCGNRPENHRSRTLACHHFKVPGWVTVLFWIWLFVSLTILVVRRVNKRRAIPEGAASDTDGVAAVGIASPEVGSPAEKVWPAPPPPEPGDDTYRLDPTEVAATGSATSLHGSSGDDPPVADAAAPEVAKATLPELLAGITMPNGLVPLTQVEIAVDLSSHVVLHTQEAGADAVRAGLSDELSRLGYDVEHDSILELRGTGERGVVIVEIHPDGAAVLDGTLRRFPTAAEGSVVVELWAG
jgi:hypothetical protein